MPAIEAIVAGLDSSGAHIFVINNNDVTCRDSVGFAAIGAGDWHANSQFMFAKHERTKPLPETLLLTYAAKKRAEVAPGVGAGTDMFTIGPGLGTYYRIPSIIIDDIDGIYKRTRVRAAKSVERANQEVTKYVEQLGQAAAGQQQTSPSPEPVDKANGKDKEGAADTGTQIKPN
jgi:hypothetical protein